MRALRTSSLSSLYVPEFHPPSCRGILARAPPRRPPNSIVEILWKLSETNPRRVLGCRTPAPARDVSARRFHGGVLLLLLQRGVCLLLSIAVRVMFWGTHIAMVTNSPAQTQYAVSFPGRVEELLSRAGRILLGHVSPCLGLGSPRGGIL